MKNELDKMPPQAVQNAGNVGFVSDIKTIVDGGLQKAYQSVDAIMVDTYWHVGRRIVEQEQNGNSRAEYGTGLLKMLAAELVLIYGNNYSERNLRHFRQFYLFFNDFEIWYARVPNLKWTHFRHLLRVGDPDARIWYLNEAASEHWSVRTLDRNISSQYYYRLLQSPKKDNVIAEMEQKTAGFESDKFEFIKNPIVAEFLGLANNSDFTESQLENAILSHLQKFILELGKGYAFVARQKHIATDAGDYFVDLVFYNYILKCFLLVDLKTTQISHQDIGQMDMYVRMFDDLQRTEGDNPTIGLILCAETSSDIAKYSILNDSKQLFAAKYLTYLPTKEQLKQEIEQQKEIFRLHHLESEEI